MNVEEKRALLFQEILDTVNSGRASIVGRVTGERLPGDGDYFESLGRLLSSEDSANAFGQVVYEALELLAYGLLCMLDQGIRTDNGESLHLALIDSETKEDLAPDVGEYHSAFMDFVLQED